MYLKRLEIQGFKSFASNTVLDFLPPQNGKFSITAIVGPNGSGKSNISDAIRWVMGETSMKNLRGKKGEDVIFNGSFTKGQLGMAEVTMTLDNSDSQVLGDYSEIVITRRAYRSGEGEYLINNSPARLLDIHLLLAKAQFAQHGYSIVGQGMIDRLLTVGPAERKDFLDEASGIKEFQIKQHQAILKLDRTRENMAQAERLIAEVEPRLRLLSRQVKKLEKRQEIEMELRETEEKYYATLFTRNKKETDRLMAEVSAAEENYRMAYRELETVQTELANLARSATRQEVFGALQHAYQEAVRAKNEWERQLAVLSGQMQTGYNEAGKQNIGWLEKKIDELKAGRDDLRQKLSLAEQETSRLQQGLTEERQKIDLLAMNKAEQNVNISKLQNELVRSQTEQNYLQLSGYAAVKAVLTAREQLGKIYGLVAELGEVDEEYRLALEVAAGSHLSSLVVDEDATARRAIEYLRERRLGVATFLPLTKIHGRDLTEMDLSVEGVIGRALDLIKFENKFSEIFSFVLGDTVVVKDLSAAQRLGIGRVRMVTLAGDLLERTGVMKGGWRQKRFDGPSFSVKMSLTGEDKLKEYEQKLIAARQELAEMESQSILAGQKLLALEVEANTAGARAELMRGEYGRAESEVAALEQELSLLKISPSDYSTEMQRLAGQKEDWLKRMAAAETEVNRLAGEIEDFNRREEEKKQRVFQLQENMQKIQLQLNEVSSRRNDLKIDLAKWETKQESLNQEVIGNMNTSVHAIMERSPEIIPAEFLETVAAAIQKLKYQLSLIGGIDEDVAKEYGETKERYDFLTTQFADLQKATADLETMIEELDELMKTKRGAAFKKIRKEFERYFKILFGGGTASLDEIYGEPPVEELPLGEAAEGEDTPPPAKEAGTSVRKKDKILTGIEIFVNPPGKKIKHLSSLSGGERTLTSIALICAILNCNPSPFIVLDEVEAALDESNTMRFAEIMAELTRQSQFVIITHNRVTMHAADALYGVVMGGDGVSKMLSVKVEDVRPDVTIDKKE